MTLPSLALLLQQLEGPYKWYIIAGVIIVLTIVVTRFVFKTIKWLLLLVAVVIIVAAIVVYLYQPVS